MHTAERVIECVIECGHNKVKTVHSTGTCSYKENYFLYRVNVFLSDVIKMDLFRFYPETQRNVSSGS